MPSIQARPGRPRHVETTKAVEYDCRSPLVNRLSWRQPHRGPRSGYRTTTSANAETNHSIRKAVLAINVETAQGGIVYPDRLNLRAV